MDRKVNILPIVEIPNSFTLMLAPPGWGKTTLVLDLYEKFEGRIVFISPLRALAEEFHKRSEGLKNVFSFGTGGPTDEGFNNFMTKEKGLLICTAEKLNSDLIEHFSLSKTLYIFDEFHLFYYWGQSFRPLLWERVMEVANSNGTILGLTATMDQELLRYWKRDFALAVDEMFLLNLGNQKLMNLPSKVENFSLLGGKVFNRQFLKVLEENTKGTILYFCRFRAEVQMWLDFCSRAKVDAIGCVGGGVEHFLEDLEKSPKPQCIFCTSTLSHGVNLPTISHVFLSYPTENYDFWVQMVGRGGRDGSEYSAFEMEKKDWRSVRYLWLSLVLLTRDFFRFRVSI